ncbi:MAG: DUF72 domain-containing protein, partial [Actinomycetota bacterium]
WRGTFYPEDLPRGEELAYAAQRFDVLEVNSTFYGLREPATFVRWRDAVPDGVVLAVKGSRFITHQKKLRDVGTAVANFLASGVLELGSRLGPILWQLPEQLRFDAERVEAFLAGLPADTDAAADLARGHDDRVAQPAYGAGAKRGMRHVLEVRHDSYLCEDMAAIARRHGVALAVSHASAWPLAEEVTADLVYVRLHGPDELYASAYDEEALSGWAERLRRWRDGGQPADAATITDRPPPASEGREVDVCFNNDADGHAPHQAARLRELLDGG